MVTGSIALTVARETEAAPQLQRSKWRPDADSEKPVCYNGHVTRSNAWHGSLKL
jgi:hypothetical protein